MQSHRALVLVLALVSFPAVGYPQPTCAEPPLPEQQVKAIVDRERATRTDLPEPFPQYRWIARRQGCHYAYIEYGLPETPEYNQIFKLNQHGVIVDAQKSGEPSNLKCPDKVFQESELAEIVRQAREKRNDLPPPFPNYRTRVDRLRCLYLYFEYALPETRGNYQVFTIDPFGELMEFFRSEPY